MLKLLREYRFYTTLAVLILIPILSLNTSSKGPEDFGPLDRAVVFVTGPTQKAISYTIDRMAHFLQNYVFLQSIKQEYSEVVEENRRLLNIIHKQKEIEVENSRLRALLQFQESIESEKITAQVIARDVTTDYRSIRINKGESSGIKRGMPVVTHEGIVGRVLRTAAHYSDVITILDNLSSIDAIIQRSRARGILEGQSDTSCLLKYALRTDDIEVGDVAISSGLDGIFPKGLMLGRVSKVSKKSYGITQEIEVKPSVDFSRLEEVLVILKLDNSV
jgi:rod shape-determining protein MreC